VSGTPPGEDGVLGGGLGAGRGTWYPGGRSNGADGRCTGEGSWPDGETRDGGLAGEDAGGVSEGLALSPDGVAGAVGDVRGAVGLVGADEEGRNAVCPIK
jgi:hypothetical protein